MPGRVMDPSATSLHDAAFWIYVRQCLYNATISQEPLDLDFSLQLYPTADAIRDDHPLSWIRRGTAWANQSLWITACVANFCFSRPRPEEGSVNRAAVWQKLWVKNQDWQAKRPKEFNPIGSGPPQNGEVFANIWFTADWHGKSASFTHI